MKKKSLLAVLALTLSTTAFADTDVYMGDLRINRSQGYFTGSGGEFTLYDIDIPLFDIGLYDPATRGVNGANSFQSFCVEKTEFISGLRHAVRSESWTDGSDSPQWSGSDSNPQSHANQGSESGPPPGDDLNPQTAYLYERFATGLLSSYDYGANFDGGAREGDAGQLQHAIWYLEGEEGSVSGQAAIWVQEAVDATGLDFGAYTAGNTSGHMNEWEYGTGASATIGPVRILNMYGGSNGSDPDNVDYDARKQDQLYLIPAPGAALLGMCGLGCIGWIKRRFA